MLSLPRLIIFQEEHQLSIKKLYWYQKIKKLKCKFVILNHQIVNICKLTHNVTTHRLKTQELKKKKKNSSTPIKWRRKGQKNWILLIICSLNECNKLLVLVISIIVTHAERKKNIVNQDVNPPKIRQQFDHNSIDKNQ